jgi:rSAM/selenodomain-associated transferase 1
MTSFDVVVGVMARAPIAGACKTRLSRVLGAERAAELYNAMLLDTLDAYSALPFSQRVLLAAPENDGVSALARLAPSGWIVQPQVGSDLGARLAHASSSLRDGAVVLASSDSPVAPLEALSSALREWEDPKRVLLGPCDDGGYYLIGLAVEQPRVFEGIPWSSPQVTPTTKNRCDELGLEVLELTQTYDVDEPADLDRLRADLMRHPSRAPRTARMVKQL